MEKRAYKIRRGAEITYVRMFSDGRNDQRTCITRGRVMPEEKFSLTHGDQMLFDQSRNVSFWVAVADVQIIVLPDTI